MSDDQEKTEQPTDKKLDDARRKGDVATAMEMRHAVMFVAALFVTGGMGLTALGALGRLFAGWWGRADMYAVEPGGATALATGVMWSVTAALAPLFGLLFAGALLIMFVQGRPTLSWSRLAPKWSKFSPVSGLGRLFGMRAMVEFGKTLLKCALVIGIAIIMVLPKLSGLDTLVGISPLDAARISGSVAGDMVGAVAMLVAALALFDFVYQHHSFLKRMRMSLQEIRDEIKQNDGDPKIKARVRSIRLQRSRHRMMAAVPTASVIITNPTHYAVALRYEHGVTAAPVVVAKGMDDVALKIRQVATEAGVPIVENPPLARALYAMVDLEHPIPVDYYAAVAEIIGFVLKLRAKRSAGAPS
ncbi:flagellar biosynthesis protein FlhB [Iodidimonas sp. SYSU 1G8]|uniref:flagellar biosynthesis protein FlhB n=1 Tax=Iodidimonas sp. SYSU 1G8 TaxID=3133967 RepID=UPI0031FE7654